ncbi:MAG: serine/threonine protein kinase [Deltaproteobacteria bacterium]|nr:serine/threonine protein kinase [Deltaproteobacteria bacterium]
MQTLVSTAGVQAQLGALTEAATDADALPPGTKAGPWIVERELGRGGMGCVYGVIHEEIGKRAALKIMHRRLVTTASAERMLIEARVVNQVGHPNIVDIFETGTLPDDGRPYIVMERLEGVPLAVRADEGKILPNQVIAILLQVCDALIAAHAAGVVHRDLKLDNIFLIDNPDDPSNPKVKLLDWGIAKVITADVRHTIEGQLVGTPQYLSPEQARGAAVSAQTDVYSLGVMAYELFLEQLPFEAETSAEIMAMHLRATPPPPSELWPDIPRSLEHLILAMLAKDPDARPTMLTVAHTLELVRDELTRRRSQPMGATAAPEVPQRISHHFSALAPTAPASFERRRPWQFVIGALAVAASVTMFLITRDAESDAATVPPRVEAAAIVDTTAPEHVPTPTLAPPPPATASVDAKQIEMDPPAAAATTVPTVTPVASHSASRTPAMHHASRKAPVTPHRPSLPLDPDGTIEPY